MVCGKPNTQEEAQVILDELVRRAIVFVKDNPDQVRNQQPTKYDLEEVSRSPLTVALQEAGLISPGYGAVLSGQQPAQVFTTAMYKLGVYNPREAEFERGSEPHGINVRLDITLQRGAQPGIEYAIGEYVVSGPLRTVFFEEKRHIFEGLGKRHICIGHAGKGGEGYDLSHPDEYLWGERDDTGEEKPLFLADGTLIVENLQPHWRKQVETHPQGTMYRPGENMPHRVDVFKPRM